MRYVVVKPRPIEAYFANGKFSVKIRDIRELTEIEINNVLEYQFLLLLFATFSSSFLTYVYILAYSLCFMLVYSPNSCIILKSNRECSYFIL